MESKATENGHTIAEWISIHSWRSGWMSERLPETSWDLLVKTHAQCEEGALAKEVFAQRYNRPVREFLSVLLHDHEKAEDLAQEFFIKVSEPGGVLERANPRNGTFRNYLRQALRNLVIDYRRRSRTETRETHPDQWEVHGWDTPEFAEFPEAEAAFHDAWVKITLADALARVRDLCFRRKQELHLKLFEARYLSDADLPPSWDALGSAYGVDQKTARDRAETVARHFRLVLRRMLRNEITVPPGAHVSETAIDDEIKALFSPLKD